MPLSDALFISEQIHEREVTLADGQKHVLYFKELPAVDFRSYQLAEHSADETVRVTSMPKLVALSVCEPDGKPAMTLERAKMLKPEVMVALFSVILDLNQIGSKAKNSSPPEGKSGSGTP